MGSVSGSGISLRKDSRKQTRKFLCLAVAAVALLTILMPAFFADDSSADTDSEFTINFVDSDGNVIPYTSPLIDDAILPFDTEGSQT